MTMRIAVDARKLSEDRTGIGRYTYEMLRRMSDNGHQWFLYSHKPFVDTDCFSSNIHFRHIHLSTRISREVWAQTVLPHWAQQDQTDLFWSPCHRLPQGLSRRIARVVTIHDLVWKYSHHTMSPLSRWLDKILMTQAVQLADRVIAISKHTTDDLVTTFPQVQEKTRLVPQGTTILDNQVDFKDDRDSPPSFSRPYILFVGTHEPRKNLGRLIAAYARLLSQTNDIVDLVLVGKQGWGNVDVEKLAAQHGVSDNVKLFGYATDGQLSQLYSKALFLAMPSLYEGFGLPLLEAMSRGTPVLTSNISSMPEVVGEAAVLVDPNCIESITSGLKRVLVDESLRRKLAIAGCKRAKQFSWDHAAQQTLNIFHQALKERGQQ